jgi:hypothetical protein
MGRYLAENLPNCRAHFCEDEGHISLIYNQLESILQPFLAQRVQAESRAKL